LNLPNSPIWVLPSTSDKPGIFGGLDAPAAFREGYLNEFGAAADGAFDAQLPHGMSKMSTKASFVDHFSAAPATLDIKLNWSIYKFAPT